MNMHQRIEMFRYANRQSQITQAVELDRRKTFFDESQTEQLCHALSELYQQYKITPESFQMHKLTNSTLSSLLHRIEVHPYIRDEKLVNGLFSLLLSLLCVQMSDDNKLLCLDILNLLIIHFDLSQLQDFSVLANFITITKQLIGYSMFAGQSILIVGNYFMKHPNAFSSIDIEEYLYLISTHILSRRNLALFQKSFWMLRVMIVSKPNEASLAALPEKINLAKVFETLFKSYTQGAKNASSNPWVKCLVDFLWVLGFYNEFYQRLNSELSSVILQSLLADFGQGSFDIALLVVFFMLINSSALVLQDYMAKNNTGTLLAFIQLVLTRRIVDLTVEACILLQNIISLYPQLITQDETNRRILFEIGANLIQNPWLAWENLQAEVNRTSIAIVQLMHASNNQLPNGSIFYQ